MNARPLRARPARAIVPGLLWHSGCHCPGCGQRRWSVGRVTAECGSCGLPMILPHQSEPEGDTQWQNA